MTKRQNDQMTKIMEDVKSMTRDELASFALWKNYMCGTGRILERYDDPDKTPRLHYRGYLPKPLGR